MDRITTLNDAETLAKQQAVLAGALNESLKTVEIEETPLAYYPSNATKIKIKVVGDLL